MTEQNIGTAKIDVVVDISQMQAAAEAAKRSVSNMSADAQAQYNKMDAAEKRRVDRLRQQADTLGMTRAQQLAYNAALRTSGPALDEITKRLAQNEAKLKASATEFGRYGLSAGQYGMAMRQLPMQMTDIFVGLSTGQRPMMVLLQQGGQLKDLFGGMVPAARAFGGAVMALVNPLTIAAATIGAAGVALTQFEERQNSVARSLIMTGRYTEQSLQQYRDLARDLDDLAGVTAGSATKAIASVAATGRFTGETLATVTRASLAWSAATGDSVDDVVEKFMKLADDPVKGLLDLNKSMNFLTEGTLREVEALKEQGRETDAAKMAFDLFADTLLDRAPKIETHIGTMSGLFREMRRDGSEAWDAVVSGMDTALLRMVDIGQRLPGFLGPMATGLAAYVGTKGSGPALPDFSNVTSSPLVDTKAYEAKAKAAEEWDRLALSNLSKREKLEREIADIRTVGAKAGKTQAEIEAQIAQARARAAEAEKKSGSKTNPADALIKRLQQQNALNLEQAATGEKLTASERLIVQVREEMERITGKVNATDRARIQTLLAEVKASGDAATESQKLAKAKEALLRLQEQLALQEQNQTRANESGLLGISRGADVVDALNRQIDIHRWYEDERAKLSRQAAREHRDVTREEEIALKTSLDWRLLQERDYQEQRRALMGDWRNGANRAWEDYLAQSQDVAGMTADAFTNAFQGMEDAFVKFAQTGKLSFSDLAQSIIADLARIHAKQLITGLMGNLFGGFGAKGAANAGGSSFFGAGGLGALGFAKGGVFQNAPSLSAYSGQVVNKPTLFAFAKGAGLMGEAGPEAIMPLKRTQGGQLGVVASGTGANVKLEVINNGSPAQASVSQSKGPDGTQIIRLVLDAVASDVASGGRTAAAIRGRFGVKEAV